MQKLQQKHVGVELFRLAELLTKLAKFWNVNGRGSPKNFGNGGIEPEFSPCHPP